MRVKILGVGRTTHIDGMVLMSQNVNVSKICFLGCLAPFSGGMCQPLKLSV